MKIHLPLLGVLLAFGLLLATPARAGDPAVAEAVDAAAEAFTARTATLPAPSAAAGFVFDGHTYLHGSGLTPTPHGVMRMSAAPAEVAGKAGWKLRSEMSLDLASVGQAEIRSVIEVLVDARLRPVSGTWMHSDENGVVHRMRVAAGEGGALRFVPVTDAGDGEAVSATPAGQAVSSFADMVLFLRLTLPEGAGVTYAASVIRSPDEDERFERAEWSLQGDGHLEGVKALVVASRRGDDTLHLYFEPGTHTLLGGSFGGGGRPFTMEFRPGAFPEEPMEEKGPAGAESPKAAALQAAMGFGTGDASILDRTFHWPSIAAQVLKANPPAEGEAMPTVEQVRARMMMNMGANMPKNPREMIEMALLAISEQIVVEMDGEDRASVQFPASFQGLRLVVGRHDERWYLVELPGQGAK
jgi:hypothetical protein